MEKRFFVMLASCFFLLFLSKLVKAYNFYYQQNYFPLTYSSFNLTAIATNEWVNIAIIFLLVFTVCLFVLRDIFKRSYASAVIVSFTMALIGSFGLIYRYGPIIPKLAPWVVVLFFIAIAFGLWRVLKNKAMIIWIWFAFSLFWLFYGREKMCVERLTPQTLCFLIDLVSVLAFILFLIYLLFSLLKVLTKKPSNTTISFVGGNKKELERRLLKLQQEYREGLKRAADLHTQARKFGWIKTKKGRELYKAWYNQYLKNIALEKEIKEIKKRISME